MRWTVAFLVLPLCGLALAAATLLARLTPWLFLAAAGLMVAGVIAGRRAVPSRRPPNPVDRWF